MIGVPMARSNPLQGHSRPGVASCDGLIKKALRQYEGRRDALRGPARAAVMPQFRYCGANIVRVPWEPVLPLIWLLPSDCTAEPFPS